MNKLQKLKFIYSSLSLYKKKLFKVIFFEIYYSIKYFKSGNFFKPPDVYPCPYYFIHKISQFINRRKISSVADLGCGSGRLTNFLNDTTDAKICGYEKDEEAFNLANKNKGANVTIKLENILNIDFDSLDTECFIFNGPLYTKEHRPDFERLIKKIEQSKTNFDQKYYFIGINLDADPRHDAEERNYIFEKKKLIKIVSASSIKKVKFFII